MRREYLGDSYDAVKRLWRDILGDWAPLHAEPRFIPEDIRAEFTALTRIPVLAGERPPYYAILNDPDTGIRLPGRANQREGLSHVALATIREQVRISGVRCVVTFDQSTHRDRLLTPKAQRLAKLRWLRVYSVPAFYYVSHAPFMFAFSGPAHLREALKLVRGAGIPEVRIELEGDT